MNTKIWNYFEMAGKLATKRRDKRKFFLGAIGVRSSDQAIVGSPNGYYNTDTRLPEGHAEHRICAKLTPGSIVYIARVKIGTGEFGLAKPCEDCETRLRTSGIKKCYYTISNSEFGVLLL